MLAVRNFDPDGGGIDIPLAVPRGDAGMPGAFVFGDKVVDISGLVDQTTMSSCVALSF